MIGVLYLDEEQRLARPTTTFLLHTAELQRTNHSTIARLFDDSVKILGDDFDRDSILLFVSDAAPYMVKAAKAISVFYPKVTHVTCLAHALHRVCEQIRCCYPLLDRFIANAKKAFTKAPSRNLLFKQMYPDVPLPPQPITTRWGTWIEAVAYYAKHFEKFEDVLAHLDEDESASVETVKELLQNPSLKKDIIFVTSNFGFLALSIPKLQKRGLTLASQIAIVQHAVTEINNIAGNYYILFLYWLFLF